MKSIYIFLIAVIILIVNAFDLNSQCSTPPESTSQTVCSGVTSTVTAITRSGIIGHRWYTVPTGGSYLTSGITILSTNPYYITKYTSSFTTTTTFYVSSVCSNYQESSRSPITVNVVAGSTPTVSVQSNPAINGGDAGGPRLTVCSGTSITLTANPSNAISPTYQWKRNATIISGATSVYYTPPAISDGDRFTVDMTSNTQCSGSVIVSSGLNITVLPMVTPTISISPSNPYICAGSNLTFTATPVNSSTPTFVWKVNGVVQSGQTGTTFSSTGFTNGQSVSVEMTAHNTCQTTNFASAGSGTITVNPTLPVGITISGNGTLCNGLGGSFIASVTNGGLSPVYEWLINGYVNSNRVTGPPPYVYVPITPLSNGDQISCRVTSNASCATNSPATSNIITITSANPVTPAIGITTNPVITGGDGNGPYLSICAGVSVTFTANSSNGGNYQWYSSVRGAISGEQGSTYTSTSLLNDEQIYVTATGITGCVSSTTATSTHVRLIVTQIVTPTVDQPYVIPYNTPATLTAIGANVGTEDYKWYTALTGGSLITSTTTPNLTVNTNYYVTKYNTSTYCESSPRVLFAVTVDQLPVVDAGSDLVIEYPYNYIALNGTASDPDGTISSYIWSQISGPNVIIPNSSNASVTITGMSAGDYVFRLTATDNLNFSSSDDVSVTVIGLPSAFNYNFIKETTVLEEGKTLINQLSLLPVEQKSVSYRYFDGLGRPMQTVSWQGSPLKKDIIQPVIYDEFGRETTKYLPYVDTNSDGHYRSNALIQVNYPASDQFKFYQATDQLHPAAVASDLNPYAVSLLESSPLNRLMQQGAPGTAWQPGTGHVLHYEYNANNQHDVLLWRVEENSCVNTGGETYNGFHYYNATMLYKNIVKNENWTSGLLHTTEEYKDFQGNVVLKRGYVLNSSGDTVKKVETYYVYDDFELLRYVLTPEAIKDLGTLTTLTQSSDLVKSLCYYYEYDGRKRMIKKQLPGAEPIYMVYDKRDRLALSQDGRMRTINQWLFIRYDVLNRPVMTGQVTIAGKTHIGLQDDFASYPAIGEYGENATNTGNIGYTLNNSFSTIYSIVETDILTVTYFDNYDFVSVNGFSGFTYDASQSYNQVAFTQVKGLATGTRVKILDGKEYTTNAIWLNNVTFYDDHYRPIQNRRDIYDGSNGGKETVSTQFDFIDKVKKTRQSQTFNGITTMVGKRFEFDHAGRLILEKQLVGTNSNDSVTVSQIAYNELGQLQQKTLGGLQALNYKYNIRGWLNQINDPDNLGTDLFAMRLNYNDGETGLNNTFQYNGNISAMVWNSTSKSRQGYAFMYDALNRLNGSDYRAVENSSWVDKTGYEEKSITYDANGNINTLIRTDQAGNNLANYSYNYNGNQLQSLTSIGTTYLYDGNGNMTTDGLRGFSVAYNILNLPKTINKNTDSINYIYSAAGEKLAKRLKDGSYMYYSGNMVYSNSKVLNYLLFDDGRVTYLSGGYTYEYNINDHLGNTRVVFKNSSGSPSVLQVAEYYPFGSTYIPMTTSTDNKHLYNGKEKQDDVLGSVALDWYDYGARFYDPQIGRWSVVDPLTENHYDWTPYNYCLNNPILLIDPFGADTSFADNATRQAFISTFNKTKTSISDTEAKLKNTNEKWAQDISSKSWARKSFRLSTKLNGLSEVKNAFDLAISSDDMYYYQGFTPVEKSDGTIIESGGNSGWSEANNRFEIQFFNTAAAGGTIVHETRHGLGYFNNEFGYKIDLATGQTVPSNYDYMDEYNSFRLGSFYNNYTNSKGYTYMTDKALKNHISSKYSAHPYIIKSFIQYK